MSEGDLRVDTTAAGHYGHARSSSSASDAAAAFMTSPMGKDMDGGEGGDFKYPERLDQYDLRGSLYKKRGGWGKHLGWKLRAFTLYQGYLCYYEAEQLHEDVDRLKPRGVLNLNNREEPVSLYAGTHKAHDHAPTEWVFQLAGPVDHNKWKLCACNKQEYDEWMAALSKLLGPPLNPRSTLVNSELRQHLEQAGLFGDDPTSPQGRPRQGSSGAASEALHHLNQRGPGQGRGNHNHHHRPGSSGGPLPPAPSLPPPERTDWGEVCCVLVFTSLAFYWGRVLSWRAFYLLLALVNVVLLNALVRKRAPGKKKKKTGLTRARSLGPKGEVIEEAGEEEAAAAKVPSKLPPIGSTLELCTTPERPPEHSYNSGRAENFKVRMGPNYRSTGRKEFSGPALYRLLHLDIYKTPCKISHIGSLLEKLPEVSGIDLPSHVSAPRLFIVNCQLPSEAPALLNAADDGPGYNVVFYFGMTQETAEALRNLGSAPPAIKLLDEYFKVAPERPDFRGRFKAMAQVWNMKELGLPAAIEKFNGKPVLITKSGLLIRGRDYAEMDINVHRFGFAAKRGLFYLQERFREITFEVGFTIEGRDDAELPEVMLGVGQFNRIDVKKALPLDY